MGTTTQKLTYLNDTKQLIKDSINSIGGNITSQTTFRQYATELDSIYASLPKVSGSGSNISLSPTKKGRITSQINGDTFQQTYTGKNLLNVPSPYSTTTWQEINIELPAGTYTMSCSKLTTNVTTGTSSLCMFYHSDSTYDQVYFSHTDKVANITITDTTTKVRIYSSSNYNNSNGKTTTFTNLMVESGSSATSYEPYVGGTASPNPLYPQQIQSVTGTQNITVCGKNLFQVKEPDYKGQSAWGDYGGTAYVLNQNGYTFQARFRSIAFEFDNLVVGQEYTISYDAIANISVNCGVGVNVYNGSTDSNKKSQNKAITTTSQRFSFTFTAIETNRIAFNSGGSADLTNLTISNIQLEQGSTATSFEAYSGETYTIHLGNIELFEDDYITGTIDNWSIKHNKVKDIFDENSDLYFNSSTSTPTERSTFRIKISANAGALTYVSNRFIYGSTTSNRIVLVSNNNRPYLSIDNTIAGINTSDTNAEKEAKIKTWLGNNNVELVYEPAEPTTTPITDTTLINDLNTFYYAMSKNGETNISVDGNLPIILDVSALKGEE